MRLAALTRGASGAPALAHQQQQQQQRRSPQHIPLHPAPQQLYQHHQPYDHQETVQQQQQQQQQQPFDPQQPLWPSQLHHHHAQQQDHQLTWLQHHHHQQQQYTPAHPAIRPAAAPQHHSQSRSASLSQALHVSPGAAAAMLRGYPALRNYNHTSLDRKLRELASLLQVAPQQLGPALVAAPKVLGFSVHELERRLLALMWLQPDKQLLSQLVLQAPLLLTWSPPQLRRRLTAMASTLALSPNRLGLLLQQTPQLLPASSHLRHTLGLLQELLLLAAVSEQAGFGSGVVAALTSTATVAVQTGPQPRQQAVAAAAAAARELAVQHPQLLLAEPEALRAHVAAMQAASGLPAAQVAAMLVSQPGLLLQGAWWWWAALVQMLLRGGGVGRWSLAWWGWRLAARQSLTAAAGAAAAAVE